MQLCVLYFTPSNIIMIPILGRHTILGGHRLKYRIVSTTLFNCSLFGTAAKHTPRYQFASKVEHITCQFGLVEKSRYTHTTTILYSNNNTIVNNEDIIFTENFNENNKVIVLSDEDFLNKTSKHTSTSIHSSNEDDVSTQTIIPETLKEDMLEFWDDEDSMLPILEKRLNSQQKKRKR